MALGGRLGAAARRVYSQTRLKSRLHIERLSSRMSRSAPPPDAEFRRARAFARSHESIRLISSPPTPTRAAEPMPADTCEPTTAHASTPRASSDNLVDRPSAASADVDRDTDTPVKPSGGRRRRIALPDLGLHYLL